MLESIKKLFSNDERKIYKGNVFLTHLTPRPLRHRLVIVRGHIGQNMSRSLHEHNGEVHVKVSKHSVLLRPWEELKTYAVYNSKTGKVYEITPADLIYIGYPNQTIEYYVTNKGYAKLTQRTKDYYQIYKLLNIRPRSSKIQTMLSNHLKNM